MIKLKQISLKGNFAKYCFAFLLAIVLVLSNTTAQAAHDEIQVNNKQDFLSLFTNVQPAEAEAGSYTRTLKFKTIVLNTDIEISSDEINDPIAQNSANSKFNNSLSLTKCSFIGNGHTITIKKGTRPIYSLFGELFNQKVTGEPWQPEAIKDLNIVYKGDVVGSAFARDIYGNSFRDEQKDFLISNIKIDVEGSILPQPELFSSPTATRNMAMGLAYRFYGGDLHDFTLNVKNNIGSDDLVKHPDAKSDTVHSMSASLFFKRFESNDRKFAYDLKNININVGGSVLAHSRNFYANAYGLAENMSHVDATGVNIQIGKDIKAYNDGTDVLNSAVYNENANIASGIARNVFNLTDSKLEVGGSIISINDSSNGVYNYAFGIGEDQYVTNDSGHSGTENTPLTINNVSVHVKGDVRAETTKPASKNVSWRYGVISCAGFMNHRNGGLENFEHFRGNNINIEGNVIAKGNNKKDNGFCIANLWGYFEGSENDFSARNIIAEEKNNLSYVAPILHFLRGEGNKITVKEDVKADSAQDYASAFANTVTEYDGNKNEIHVKSLVSKNPFHVGAFASDIDVHHNHNTQGKDRPYEYVAPDVKNVHIKLDKFEFGNATNSSFVGGFVGKNYGSISDSSVEIPDVSLVGEVDKYFGGFVGYNAGPIKNSATKTGVLETKGDGSSYLGGFVGFNKEKIENSSSCVTAINVTNSLDSYVGGFIAHENGTNINANYTVENSAAFINDSITVNGGGAAVGGFIGYGTNIRHNNNSAQIGENINVKNTSEVAMAGGYGAFIQGKSVDKSTALTFGKISVGLGQSDDKPNINAGFIALSNGVNINKSSSYVGDIIEKGSIEDTSISTRLSSPSIGLLNESVLNNFTVLSHNKDLWKYYVNIGENSTVTNPYFVHVALINRTAYKLSVDNDGKASLGEKLGKVQIAIRDFQKNYWEDSASPDKVSLPYTNFDYLINPEAIQFTHISKDSSVYSQDAKKATLTKYCTRHAALLSDNNVTYDILGIKGNTIKVIFDLNYNKPDNTPAGIHATVEIKDGNSVTKKNFPKNPERAGYVFMGWQTEDGQSFNADTLVETDITVYAQWKKASMIPQTGDTANPLMYLSLLLISFLLGFIIIKNTSKKLE